MIQRLVMLIAALAATAASAVVVVIAAALAGYALAKPWIGEAGAAAAVAATFAVLIGLCALAAALSAKGKGASRVEQGGLMGRLSELAKSKPWAAAGVAVAAIAVAARNPAAVGAIALALFEGVNRSKPAKR